MAEPPAKPVWERGWMAHGLWRGIERLGFVGRATGGRGACQRDGYTWGLDPAWSKVGGWEPTLKRAKRAVERALAAADVGQNGNSFGCFGAASE